MANLRETIVFRRQDDWVHDFICKIVEVKRAAGISTSFSHEVVRIVINGLLDTKNGVMVDREIAAREIK